MGATPGEQHEPSKSRKRRPSEGEGSIESLNNDEPKANRGAYECRICKQPFQKSTALGGHMNRHRSDREKETPQEAPKALVQKTLQQHQGLSLRWDVQRGLGHFKMSGLVSSPIRNFRVETKYSSNNLTKEFNISIAFNQQQNPHWNQDSNMNANSPRGVNTVPVKNEPTANSFHDGGSAK